MNFVTPLNVHSDYEIAQSILKVEDYIKFAKENSLKAVTLTNNSTMSGIVEFYILAKDNNLKPIIGVEFNICKNKATTKRKKILSTITLFAKNSIGFKNLVQLTTFANIDGKHDVPRIDIDILKKYSEGLICIINDLFPKRTENALFQEVKSYRNIFNDDLYIGLTGDEFSFGEEFTLMLIKFGQTLNVKIVITDEIRYLKKEELDTLEFFNVSNITDGKNVKYVFGNHHIKKVNEIRKIYKCISDKQFNEYLNNIDRIISKCNVDLDEIYSFNKLPKVNVPHGFTTQTYLEKLVKDGINKRYSKITKEIEDRYKYELEIIKNKNLANYFLVVWDFINFAKQNNVPYCYGRGSAPSSIVCYALSITNVDPIKNGLLFERFLNPKSTSMPDIDIEFGYPEIKKITQYINEKYHNKTAKIITFCELSPRLALMKICRFKDIPRREYLKIKDVIDNEKAVSKLCQNNQKLFKSYMESQNIIGIKFDKSTHIAGMIISPVDLDKYIPLEYNKDKELVTQYSRQELEKLGFVKFDFIPNRELSFLNNILKEVQLNFEDISLDDNITFELLRAGNTDNIYGMSNTCFREYLVKLKPNTFSQVCALLSLYRELPITAGLTDEYIARKNGKKFAILPALEPILSETYGLIVYDEQVTQLIHIMTGCSTDKAEIIRRNIKKGVAFDENNLIDMSIKNGFDEKTAKKNIGEILTYGKFAFMKSHAIGYTMQCYSMAYLKAHYPKYFVV